MVLHLKAAANDNGWLTYFREIQMYLTCLQYSKYTADIVYMVLMYGSKIAVSLAITEDFRQQDVMLEVSLHYYHRLTGFSQLISADECMHILNQTFRESLLRGIDQLVHWITN